MRVKHIRKLAILLVTILCIGAVSAVSFAAWTGERDRTLSSISVGSVEYLEFSDRVDAITVTGEETGKTDVKLFPYDQPIDELSADGVRYLKVTIYIRTNISYNVGISQGDNWSGLAPGSGLYFTTDGPTGGDEGIAFKNGKLLDRSDVFLKVGWEIVNAGAAGTVKETTFTFYLYLKSAAYQDMGKQLSIDLQISQYTQTV